MPKIKVSKIKKRRKFLVRQRLDDEAIARYCTLYKRGKAKPVIIQKGTNALIDGWHRLEALKTLGIEEVEVEERDIPDSELLVEAYRLNKGHGVPITAQERNNLIIQLRFKEKRGLEEIGKLVDLSAARVKQICDDFRFLHPQETKIDLRKKIDSKEIIADYLEGMKQKEIADKYPISQSRVSQIVGKFGKWKEKGSVNLLIAPHRFQGILNKALYGGLFESCILDFRKEGVFVEKYDSDKQIALFGFFPKHYFVWYEAKEEMRVLCDGDLLAPFRFHKAFEANAVALSFSEKMVTMETPVTNERFIYSLGKTNGKSLLTVKVDERGFVENTDLKLSVDLYDFLGMSKEGEVRLSLENDQLHVDCVMPHNWKAIKVITPLKIEGGIFSLRKLSFDAKHLSHIMNILRSSKGRWISFFKDKPIMVITANESRELGLLNWWFAHFLIRARSVM